MQGLEAWRGAEGHPVQIAYLQNVVRTVFPTVEFLSFRTKNCITTAAGDLPLLRELRHGGRILAVGNCQGKSVMASYGIGEDVAELLVRGGGASPGK